MYNIQNKKFPFPYKNDKALIKKIDKPKNLCNEIEGISWPKKIPKNYKHKDKYYIHYAAEHQNEKMLNKAIKDKHDLSLTDNNGKNAIHYLFAEKKSFLYEPKFKLIDPDFFYKIVITNKKSWNSTQNTFDLFDYFKRQTGAIIKYNNGWVYDEDKFKETLISYEKIIRIIKDLNLKLELSTEQFNDLCFYNTIQGFFLEDALMASSDKQKSLTRLIELVNFFNTSKPLKFEPEKTKDSIPFIVVLDEFGYYCNNTLKNVARLTRSHVRHNVNIQQIFGNTAINENACQDTLYEMFEKHILNNIELRKYFTQSDELLNLLNEYNKILYSKILANQLNTNLQEKRCIQKRVKI